MSVAMRSSVIAKAGRLAGLPATARAYATSIPARAHHQVLIVGAGTAGVTVAAQLKRALGSEKTDIAILDPASSHHYQVCTPHKQP
jgi:sulfide:quinone oxidoreductase